MTLALLLTAVGGAWAQTETLLTTITATAKEQASYSTANVATVSFSYTADGSSAYLANWGWWGYGWIATVTAAEGYTITKCIFYDDADRTATDSEAPFVVETTDGDKTPRINGTPIDGGNMWSKGIKMIEVYGYVTPASSAEPAIDVTTNAAEEGATFTEASFLMPTYDVDVNYELVRDMTVDVTAEVGDGSDGYRIRIKKDGNDFVPVNAEEMLISVSDDLDDQHPIDLTVNTDFTSLVQKKGEGDTWTDLSNEDKLSVGTFRYKVTGVGNYTGTIYSNEFELYQGYEVVIPAGEYITYYKDEALKVEDEDAKLYTITAVEDGKAVLSDASDVMPSNTPFLVHNNGTEEKTILLIPCNEPNLAVTVANEFKGTMEATTIEASTDAQANYVFNGKQFVWVKNALTIGANKAWLSISNSNARAINLVFDETTKITTTNLTNLTNGNWYDLNGRKLDKMPTKKGVYILNGKKVVIK